jgi:predicted nuclease with TOPRIM domain
MTDAHRLTVDLQDRIDEIQDRLNELRGELGSLEAEFRDLKAAFDPTADDTDADTVEDTAAYTDLNEEYTSLKETEQKLVHARNQIQDAVESWDGSEFEVKKPRWGEMGHINDLVLADTIRDDLEDPRAKLNARKQRTVQICVTSTPPDAPDDPKRFPNPVGEFLYQRIENLNEYGEADLTDFSLSASASESAEQPD